MSKVTEQKYKSYVHRQLMTNDKYSMPPVHRLIINYTSVLLFHFCCLYRAVLYMSPNRCIVQTEHNSRFHVLDCSFNHTLALDDNSLIYRQAQKLAPFLYALTSSNIIDFHNYITVRIRRKFVIILSQKIPPHLKCVATLPCEMSNCRSVSLIGHWRRQLECVVQQQERTHDRLM